MRSLSLFYCSYIYWHIYLKCNDDRKVGGTIDKRKEKTEGEKNEKARTGRSAKWQELYPTLKLKSEWRSIAGNGSSINHHVHIWRKQGSKRKKERRNSPVGAPFIICVNWMPAWSWEHLLINIQDRAEDAEWCWVTEAASERSSAWLCCRTFTPLQQLGRCVCTSGFWFISQDEANEWLRGHREDVGSVSAEHWLNQPLRHKQLSWVTQQKCYSAPEGSRADCGAESQSRMLFFPSDFVTDA